MDYNPIPTLMVHSSGIPGLIKLNEMVVGEVTQDMQQKIPIPVSPSGTFFLTFIPLIGNKDSGSYISITRKIIFQDGEIITADPIDFWDNISIVKWPGNLYEVTIHPLYLPYPSASVSIPKTIDQLSHDFDNNGSKEIASIFIDNNLHLVIEDLVADRVVFDYTPLYAQDMASLSIQDITQKANPQLIIRGPSGNSTEFLTIISFRNGQYHVLLDIYGHEIRFSEDSPARLQVMQRVHDTCQHGVLYTYTDNGEAYVLSSSDIVWYYGKPQWPQSPQNTARAFLEALKLDLEKEAMGYLSQPSRSSITYQGLKRLLGTFDYWIEPAFSYQSYVPPNVILGLTYAVQPNYQQVEHFRFEIVDEPDPQGKYKINHIMKIG